MSARDRLAAIRARQGGHQHNSSIGARGGRSATGPTGSSPPREDPRREMTSVGAPVSIGGDGEMATFYTEINSIQDKLRTYNDNVARISELHARSLNNMDEGDAQRNSAKLDVLVEDTSDLSNDLKPRIEGLGMGASTGRNAQVRKSQIGLIRVKFVEAIQSYQQVEHRFRNQHKQRMERQLKIVKPNATSEEIRAVVDGDGNTQIFSQALMHTTRGGETKAAFREVQRRHEDIKRIEKTLVELAQMFNEMSALVAKQDDTLNAIEAYAATIERDTEAGLKYTEKAVASARAARKKRWICFWVLLAILILIAIAITATVLQHRNNNH